MTPQELQQKIDEIKAQYPKELNIEGLEPALTQDFTELAEWAYKLGREEANSDAITGRSIGDRFFGA